MGPILSPRWATLTIVLMMGGAALAGPPAVRWFSDRQIAWSENDEQDVPAEDVNAMD